MSRSYNGTQLRKADIVCPVDLMCGVELPGKDPGLDFTAILCEKISSQSTDSIMDEWKEFCRIDGKLI